MIETTLEKIAKQGAEKILIPAGKQLKKKLIDRKTAEHMMISSGQFLAGFEADSDLVVNDMALVLSEDNMKKLARELESDTGYTYKAKLMNWLQCQMGRYDIPHDQAEVYAANFMCMILSQLPELDIEKYDRLFQQEWKDEQDKALKALSSKIEKINTQLRLYNENKLQIYSASQLDMKIKSETINPKIGIDFFEIDDESFIEIFNEIKNEEIIHVRAKCREEAIYCIINELWRSGEERPVFIVKNANDWSRLAAMSESGNIYIPWFYADNICAISNNTNIFIYTDGLPSFSRDEIVLRPRTYRTISRALERAGMDINSANKLVSETHGLYIPMKKKIFNGQYMKRPEWIDKLTDKIKNTCLLVGQWTDADGDKALISELSGMEYGKFIEMITPYTQGEDPFICEVKERGQRAYYLASVENSWEYLDVDRDNSMWEVFINLFIEVLNESEKLFTYDYNERVMAQFRGEKLFWSGTIRNGMIRSLIMKAYYKNDAVFQAKLDSIVKEVLDYIKTEEQWRYISNFFIDLCEMAPDVVLDRLYKELDSSTGLMELFEKQSPDILFGRNDYINILFGVDEFLVQREYAARGYEWLLRLDDKSYEYKSNSPRDSIGKVLCVWHNFSVYTTPEEKIDAARKAIRLDKNAWDYVYKAQPYGSGQSMMGCIHGPKYRYHEYDSVVIKSDMYETIKGYMKILVDNAGFNPVRWEKLLKISEELSDYMADKIIASMLDSMVQMSDIEQMQIKNSIRRIIYRHRYFANADWAMGEEKLARYVKLLDEIQIKTEEYEYEYLFEANQKAVLLNPSPYNSDCGRDDNDKMEQETVKNGISEFKKKKLSLAILANVCAGQSRSKLGTYLARYWGNGLLDIDIFKVLYHSQDTGIMALDYCYELAERNPELFYKIIELNEELKYSDIFLADLYSIQAMQTDGIPEIADADEPVKRIYWRKCKVIKAGNYEWQLEECRKYGDVNSYAELLYTICEDIELSIEDRYRYILGINKIDVGDGVAGIEYYLPELLKPLQEYYIDDEEKADKIAEIEIAFFNILQWQNMRCFQKEIKRAPDLYAELVSIIYRKDGEDVQKEQTEEEKRHTEILYKLFSMAHFCPAEKDGVVDAHELEQWIEDFKALLKHNHQSSLFGFLTGRLWVYSPVGKDGHCPCEAVRNVIEQYADDDMKSEYRVGLYNKRGVFSPSAGRDERVLAQGYKDNADYLSLKYPVTASVFYELYRIYMADAESERGRAENGYM